MNRVLVIGERPDAAKELAFRLGLLGFEAAASSNDLPLALRSVFAFQPNAIVLDAGESDESHELFQMLQQVSETPTLVVGDVDGEADLIWYLDEGAVAYLARPVSPMLLSAQLSTVLKRAQQNGDDGVITVGNVTIDLVRHRVNKNGAKVTLTPTEFRLLRVLVEHAGRPCSRKFLLEQVWGDDFAHCSHYLRLYMGYLRQKLEDDPKQPKMLATEWGLGYRLIAERPATAASMVPAYQPQRATL